MRVGVLAGATLLSVLGVEPVAGQKVVQVKSARACETCRVRMTQHVTITDSTGLGALSLPYAAAMDSRGNVFVSTGAAPYRTSVYGPDGVLRATIGSRGEGPGEFMSVGVILAQGDTLNIFDTRLARWTQFDAKLEPIHTARLPTSVTGAVVWNGRLVANMELLAPGKVGYPLHEISREGTVIRSFGYAGGDNLSGIPYTGSRVLAVCPNGSLWYSGKLRYELTRVAPDGSEEVLRRNATWFVPHLSRPGFTAEAGPPPPMLAQLHCDIQNRLWTLTHVADERWREAGLREAGRDYHGTKWEQTFDPHRYWDTIIEVIDPARGRVVTAARSDFHILYFLADGVVAAYHEQEGDPSLVLWRLEIVDSGINQRRN